MERRKSVVLSPPSLNPLSAISHVGRVSIRDATFNLYQGSVNQGQPLVDDHKIPDWLTSIDFNGIQKDTFSKHTTGTGTWLLEHRQFQRWLYGEIRNGQILWVKGMLGAGKTILSSIVIDHLERTLPSGEGDTAILFAYCRHSDRYSLTDILASFVKQLAQRHSDVLSLVKSIYMNHREDGSESPRHPELLDILQQSIYLFKRVYIIVDALDELPDDARSDLLKALVPLRARLLITSRPSIAPYFLQDVPYIEIGDKNQRDIELFISQKIKESTDLADLLGQNAQIQSHIYEKLNETSTGMFLIATLQIESLKNCTTVNELRNATESLSSNINDTYSSTWERINAQPERAFLLARRAIFWLVYAYRPLQISELQHALAVQHAKTFDNDDIAPAHKILSVCCGLIVVDKESQIVHFVHFTALDFFRNLGHNLYPTPHASITESCLWYLSESQLTGRKITNQDELRDFRNAKGRPLRDYAYRYWGYHARRSSEEVGQRLLPPAVSDFLEKCGQYPCVVNGTEFDLFERSHIVAYYGLPDIPSSNAECSNQYTACIGFTPLVLACVRGNEENVEALLSHTKASVNTPAKNGLTALHAASRNGHEGVVRLLLSHNEVAINDAQKKKDIWRVSSVLHKFVSHGKVAVNKRAKDGQTPLIAASSMGHVAIVKLLLSRPDIDVNVQTKDGRTALFAAAYCGHEAVVNLLLTLTDIAVNVQSEHGWTALFAASRNCHDSVVNSLLSRTDIAVNTQTKGGWSALIAASGAGHGAVVRLLLTRKDIAVKAQTEDGWTALFIASHNGYGAVVELLLSHPDIDVNAQTKDGRTALFAAAYCGHEAVVKLLLGHTGIAVNAQSEHGWTALFAASRNGHEGIVDLLLSRRDIAVNTQTEHGWTALIAASSDGHEGVVRLLLSHRDVALYTQTKEGQTALAVAFHNGHAAVIRLLTGE